MRVSSIMELWLLHVQVQLILRISSIIINVARRFPTFASSDTMRVPLWLEGGRPEDSECSALAAMLVW
jgi:hypothetical protein